jgi:hypothetical protein
MAVKLWNISLQRSYPQYFFNFLLVQGVLRLGVSKLLSIKTWHQLEILMTYDITYVQICWNIDAQKTPQCQHRDHLQTQYWNRAFDAHCSSVACHTCHTCHQLCHLKGFRVVQLKLQHAAALDRHLSWTACTKHSGWWKLRRWRVSILGTAAKETAVGRDHKWICSLFHTDRKVVR